MVLHMVLLTSGSGLGLFSKQFSDKLQARIGALIVTMVDLSRQSVGWPLSHIAFEEVSVSVVTDPETAVVCSVFFDSTDGGDFGRLVAWQVLCGFTQRFKDDLANLRPHMNHFQGFEAQLSAVMENCVQPVLERLGKREGIHMALVSSPHIGPRYTTALDQLSVNANLQTLLHSAADLASFCRDVPVEIAFQDAKLSARVFQLRFSATLVVVCKTDAPRHAVDHHIADAIALLEQVLQAHATT